MADAGDCDRIPIPAACRPVRVVVGIPGFGVDCQSAHPLPGVGAGLPLYCYPYTPPVPDEPTPLGAPLLGARSVQAAGTLAIPLPAPTAAGDPAIVAQGLAVGDQLLAVLVWDGSGGAVLNALPSDWTMLLAPTAFGTRRIALAGHERLAGDPSTYNLALSVNASHRAALGVVRGARPFAEWVIGALGTRAGGSGTSTTTIAPSISVVVDDSRVVSIAGEATSTGSGSGELVSVSGADLWFFAEQGGAGSGAIETIAAAATARDAGATPPVTFTYQNAQTSNGAALQVAAPGLTIPGGSWNVEDLLADDPFLVAHRCHGGWWPENTLYAASQAGYADKAIDIDVWRSSDGVFVVHHDQSTLRMTGTDLDIPSTPWATLQALMNQADECVDPAQPLRPMARLEEILDVFLTSHVVSVEMKGPSAAMSAFLDLLDDYDAADRLIVQGFAGGQSQLTQAHDRGYTTWANGEDDEPINFPSRFTGSNVDLVGLNWDASEPAWAAMVGFGKPVIGHVIGSRAQGDQAVARGAVGLTVSRW